MFVMLFHVILRPALQGRKRTDLLCMTHECAHLCVRGASRHVFFLPWFTSTYVCVGALPCGGGPWHDAGEFCKKKHQASFLPPGRGAAEPWGGDAVVWVTGVQGCSGWAGSVHTPADVRECTSGNSMPHQSPYLKTVLQFLLQNFIEGL